MDKVARLPVDDRAALFGETGASRGVADTIMDKDFWVGWSLKRLFSLPKGTTATLVFKGGTSLSKAFGAIRRFSVPRSSNSLESRPPASGRSRSTPQTPRQSTSIIPRRY